MPSIRVRDMRSYIKEMGYEQGMAMTLELLLEERVQEREHMRELTQLVAQCIENVERMVLAGTGMQDKLKELQRKDAHDE